MRVVIGEIARSAVTVSPDTKCEEVYTIFNNHPSLDGIVVSVNDKPIGLVMKTHFFQKLSIKYGFDLFMQRAIELVMEKDMLKVDYSIPLTNVSSLAMKRSQDNLYDYVIVIKQEKLYGVVSIRELINKLSEIQIHIARLSNPLSGLPGNHVIDETLKELLSYKEYSIFYIDLDSFKAFNDTYGFKKGDELIKETAKLIKEIILRQEHNPSFVGHIGGDDFIATVSHYHYEEICKQIITQFERAILQFYSDKDIERGYVRTYNRKNVLEDIPLVSISIAVIQNRNMVFHNIEELSREAAEVKRACKEVNQSIYLTLDDIHDKRVGKV